MAKIITCEWTRRREDGRKIRCRAYGYTLMVNGKRERKFSGEWQSKDEALRALVARQDEIRAGRIERAPDRTLGQLVDEYVAYKKGKKRSLWLDEHMLRERLLPALGAELPVRKLTAEQIARYEAKRSAEVTAFTVCNELGCLRHALNLGRKWGYLATVPEITPPAKPRGRDRFLSASETARLLEACDASGQPLLGTMVRVAIASGMRRAELLGLTWPQVNLSTSTITLYKTKSGEPRAVPINATVYEALTTLEPDEARRHGPVFPRDDEGRTWRDVRDPFLAACEQAGITGFRWHDLRHTCASWLLGMNGRTLRDVQEVLGHGDLRMSMKYAHLSAAHKLAAVETLDGLIPKPQTMARRMASTAGTDPLSVPKAPDFQPSEVVAS